MQTVSGTVSIKTPDNAAYVRFCIEKDAYDVNKIMFNEGSTVLPYEPYTGGKPSPSPEYPQPITSAGKYNEKAQKYEYQVKLTGKNLWNAEEAAETSKWVASTSQRGYSDFAIEVKPGEKVTFSFPEKLPLGKGFYAGIVTSENGSIIKWLYYDSLENFIVQQATVTAITDKIWIRCNAGGILNFVSGNPYFQVEYGEERTDFQPYKEQTVTLTSDRPLTKWDKLEKRKGQWGWVYKSAEVVLDGSENGWNLYNFEGEGRENISFTFAIKDKGAGYQSSLCYSYINKDGAWANPKYTGVTGIYSDNESISVSYFRPPNKDISTLDQWKEWLASNPLTLWYETAEETFVPLSESEQEQMNALHTYYPTTTISNDAGCEMTIKYIADTKAYIDSKIAAIQAAVVNRI